MNRDLEAATSKSLQPTLKRDRFFILLEPRLILTLMVLCYEYMGFALKAAYNKSMQPTRDVLTPVPYHLQWAADISRFVSGSYFR